VSFSISNTSNLGAGQYYGLIVVSAPGVLNSPQYFEVDLGVTAQYVSLIPIPPALIFLVPAGGVGTAQPVMVFNPSAQAVTYWAIPSVSWLSVTPATGNASLLQPALTAVNVNATGLGTGVYFGEVYYAASGQVGVRSVYVVAIVLPAGFVTHSAPATSEVTRTDSQAGCTPSIVVPVQTGLANNFSVPASWPAPLTVQVYNDCGSTVGNAQVTETFTNGDPPLPLALVDATNGIYSATWTPGAASSQVTVTSQAVVAGLPAGTSVITGSVEPNSAPTLAANGVTLPFNSQTGGALAPGAIVTINGSNFATTSFQAASSPLPTSQNGTSVTIGGVSAPLFSVSPGQISAQIPFELAPSGQYQVVVQNNGAQSAAQTIQLAAGAPGLAANADGTVIAEHWEDFSLVTSAAPASPGDYLVLYLVGMGQTDNVVADGAPTPLSPLSRVTTQPTVTIGGVNAPVLFAGLCPGWVGLYQVNVQVPSVPASGSLPIVVTQGGVSSNTALVAVQK
jgi:uncharacterized protein (TIGR03437 family)